MSIFAETLMTNRFLRISTQHTLREALGLLLYGEEKGMDTGAIVVIDTQGDFAGILTPDCLVRSFGSNVADAENEANQSDFIESVSSHMQETVDSVMHKGLPTLNKSSAFSAIIKQIGEGRYECLPVLEEHRVVGLVYATDIFKAAANLALTPEQEGIHLTDEE